MISLINTTVRVYNSKLSTLSIISVVRHTYKLIATFYRLDPAFRGKGLCELMTKPIEAFDLQRDFVEDKDYDFYELDRNSLEPNCPDTLRGPGLLHSGFLSNKRPGQDVDRWKDRIDWYDRSSQSEYERHYNERRRVVNSNRRYQNEVYVPYQIGEQCLLKLFMLCVRIFS